MQNMLVVFLMGVIVGVAVTAVVVLFGTLKEINK